MDREERKRLRREGGYTDTKDPHNLDKRSKTQSSSLAPPWIGTSKPEDVSLTTEIEQFAKYISPSASEALAREEVNLCAV